MEILEYLGHEEKNPFFLSCHGSLNGVNLNMIKSNDVKYFKSENEILEFIINSLKEKNKTIGFHDFRIGNEYSLYTRFLKGSNTIAMDTMIGCGNSLIVTGVFYNTMLAIEQFLPKDEKTFALGRFSGIIKSNTKQDFSLICYKGNKDNDCGLKYLKINDLNYKVTFNENWENYFNIIVCDKDLIKHRWISYMTEECYV